MVLERRGTLKFRQDFTIGGSGSMLPVQWRLTLTSFAEDFVACPFFMPEQRFDSDWPFPQRLPLGAGWAGTCTAPGHEGARPNDEELKSGCNLGYAKTCGRFPAERHADAVRFALGEERDGILRVLFICEREYLPAGHGELLYQTASASWLQSHATRACNGWPSAT